MDTKQFREFAKATVDYIAEYVENIEKRPVVPEVSPGYLYDLIPSEPPEHGEAWQDILDDVEKIIMPGITHWQSPRFHGYYPTGCSFPSIVGEMMSASFGCVGINWMASPAYTELEVVMMNWLGKLLGLPEGFLNCSDGPGGGVIQGSASETTFIALLIAKERKVKELLKQNPSWTEGEIKAKLVAYSSDQSNSSVEKAGLLGSMPMRLLKTDKKGQLRGDVLLEAIQKDMDDGLVPCYVVANLGTTPTCAFDKLNELGPICRRFNIWLHVDAAYAGSAFICPEYRYLMDGIEFADSFNFNPHKWMLVNFDCSAMWVRDARHVIEAFSVERIYLKDNQKGSIPEYRHWQISLGRRFRALKLWFVLRTYGVEGIQNHIRHQIGLAKYFEELVRDDGRFEVITSNMGLVCFRLKGDDSLTVKLYEKVMQRKNIYIVNGHFNDMHVIRFVICSPLIEKEHVNSSWYEFSIVADEIVGNINNNQFDLKALRPGIEITNQHCQKEIDQEKSK